METNVSAMICLLNIAGIFMTYAINIVGFTYSILPVQDTNLPGKKETRFRVFS